MRANRRVRPPETSSIALLDVYNEMRLQLGLPPRPR
jgi:hypothetical protein